MSTTRSTSVLHNRLDKVFKKIDERFDRFDERFDKTLYSDCMHWRVHVAANRTWLSKQLRPLVPN